MTENKLKLFVWTAYNPDYTDGLAFAIAEDETEARKMVLAKSRREPFDWGDLAIYSLTTKIAEYVNGGG